MDRKISANLFQISLLSRVDFIWTHVGVGRVHIKPMHRQRQGGGHSHFFLAQHLPLTQKFQAKNNHFTRIHYSNAYNFYQGP